MEVGFGAGACASALFFGHRPNGPDHYGKGLPPKVGRGFTSLRQAQCKLGSV